jgi:L-galactonate 5-dehydrogenase
MKALQVQAPGKIQLIDVPVPRPKSDEVLLRIQMVGMCGSDLNTFRGNNPLVT